MASMVAGSNAALTAENPGLSKVLLGLGWDVVPSHGPQSELVPMAIMCGQDGRALSEEHLVFFNQISSPEGSLEFAGTEDQEQIDVDLPRVPEAVHKISILVYVDPEVRGPGTFGAVKNAYIRVANEQNLELLRFDIPKGDGDSISAMLFGELYRHGDGWKFRALGQGYGNGLAGVAADFRLKL
ncbi:TerD family protein [Arthrobacter cavernae]|uniref:TerD family protein n=1 Tax=Arthrobacter cavernae TaxID=2817681 RepID=A0A939KMH3_9MICC|nr:TerD family protein [Arthrobacter cavernae]MBO1268288.1 TerD family protein [Arthrobacter cavernae]